jgi:putative transposase
VWCDNERENEVARSHRQKYCQFVQIVQAYRFAIVARPDQARALARFSGGLRWIWNEALAEQRRRLDAQLPYAGYVEMAKWLTAWRNSDKTKWLASGPTHPQQQVLKRLDEAFRRFMSGKHGSPRFKRRGEDPGIRYPDPLQFRLDPLNGRLACPKMGWLRLRMSRDVTGEIRNVSISREGERWFASLQVERNLDVTSIETAPTLGVDLGVAAFAATSHGQIIPPLHAFGRQIRRVARLQRRIARKVKGSRNQNRLRGRLARLHRRIAHQRRDWLHQLSTRLANEHPVMALEDLRVQCMSASARGSHSTNGRSVRTKSRLNRAILDQGWGEFRRQLEYKTRWRGGGVFAVSPAYTSLTCCSCGSASRLNRPQRDCFICLVCGHTEHADVNAAKNILAAGHAAWARAGMCAARRLSREEEVVSPVEAGTHRCEEWRSDFVSPAVGGSAICRVDANQ